MMCVEIMVTAPRSCARPMRSWRVPMNDAHRQDRAWQDPIVAEVRAVRSALFAASGNDIREFCRRLREKQAVSGHDILTRVSQSGLQSATPPSTFPPPRPIG